MRSGRPGTGPSPTCRPDWWRDPNTSQPWPTGFGLKASTRCSSWVVTPDHPAGPYPDALSFLRALLDADPGLRTVGVTAYPDGHPLIGGHALDEALAVKQALLAEAGVSGYASTQMCFDPRRIDQWLQAHRRAGMVLPVHLGLAGVVDRAKLMSMGVRLGVGTSLKYLRKNRSALTKLMASPTYDPNKLLEPLSPILEAAGIDGIHCFTFNQVEATAAWQRRLLET